MKTKDQIQLRLIALKKWYKEAETKSLRTKLEDIIETLEWVLEKGAKDV